MSKTASYTGALFARIDGQHYAMDYTAYDVKAWLNNLTAQLATIQAQGEHIRQLRTEAITAQATIDEQRETIKGLDRAGQRYKEIIEQYRKEALEMQRKISKMERSYT